jgi:iron complex outermembrane receptor protein
MVLRRRVRTRPETPLVIVLLWLALGAGAIGAETEDDARLKRMTLEELGNIVVTSASKEPEAVWRTSAAIYVLTQRDIHRSGVTTIADALRLVPGVEVARIDASRNWVVGVRGFGDQFSKSVLVLIDGRSVYTPLFAGVEWSTQDTLLEDIDRIEVIRGPGGTVWGANAVNGVINIITKSAADSHGVYARAAAGNVDQGLGGVRYGGSTSAGLHYRAYAKGFVRGPEYHTDGRDFDRGHMGQAGGRVDWQGNGRDAISVHGDVYQGRLGESVRVATFVPPASTLVDRGKDVSGQNMVVRWARDLGEGADFLLQTYYDRTYRLGIDWGETRQTFDVDFIHHRPLVQRHDLIWGAGLRSSPSTYVQTISGADFQPHESTSSLYSAFVQDTVTLVANRLSATAGAKLEHNNYTGLETQPSVRLLWTPGGQQAMWGAVTRAVRTPSRVDEDIRVDIFAQAVPPLYAVVAGNRAIKPESLVSTEAGYRTLVGSRVYVDVAAFHNRYDNLVDLGATSASTQTTDGVSYTAITFPWSNGIRGTTDGIEIASNVQFTPGWRIKGSYSYLHLDLENKPGNTDLMTLGMLEGGTPHHQVVVHSQFDLSRRWELDPIYRYVSARTFGSIPAYHTADFRIAHRITPEVEMSLVGQNLLQPHHPEWARDPGPTVEIRRRVYAQIAWGR